MFDLTQFILQAQAIKLPHVDGTTVFLALLSLCAVAAIWGIYQLLSVLRGGDDNPIERRLGESDFQRAAATDAALVRTKQNPAWMEASQAMQQFATRLDLVSPGQPLLRLHPEVGL